MVDTSAAFTDAYVIVQDSVSHSHGAVGEHQHGDLAFTTWLDPMQAIAQAAAIRDALSVRRPESAADFEQQFDLLAVDLVELDRAFSEITQKLGTQTIFFSHPVYQYFIRRYGLNGLELHWEPDMVPTPEQWDAFTETLSKHPSSLMIWEGRPGAQNREKLKAIGLRSVTFEPVGSQPDTGDYLTKMLANINNFKNVVLPE